MPPYPTIAGVFRCEFFWSGTESSEAQVVSVQHFEDQAGGQSSADLGTALNDAVQTHQFEGLHDDTLVDHVNIVNLNGVAGAAPFSLPDWHGESGTGVDRLPGCSILVLGNTGLRGSRHRGRLFLPSVVEDVVDHGQIIEANRVEIETAWRDFQDALTDGGNGFSWGVASYTHSDFTVYPTDQIRVDKMMGFIKRRRNRS